MPAKHPEDLRGAARTLALVARVLERAAGELTLAQYRVLALVADGDERASRLALRLAVGKPTVTAVVDGLAERGYLERRTVPDDRRATRLVLTDSGRAALETAEIEMARRVERLVDRAEDREALLHGIAAMRSALESLLREKLGTEGGS